MLRITLKLLFIICFCEVSLSQRWTDKWELLYRDDTITVEIQYYMPNITICKPGGKEFKYKYRVRGRYYSGVLYLNWRLNYLDCDGKLICQRNSIEIGKIHYEDISGGRNIESLDYKIPADSIYKPYEVKVSTSSDMGRDVILSLTSTNPQKIEGAHTIFSGEEVVLTVRGGSLGQDADWYWYEGRCGGRKIGQGQTIKYAPTETQSVFVRAESKYNITQCAEVKIEVDERSKPAEGITGREKICRGESVVLTVKGGALGKGADWYWYTGSCGGHRVGRGASIKVTPKATTQYFVRAEGDLNITSCAIITISVNGRSSDPDRVITSNSLICEGQAITLTVIGGSLGEDAEWYWYDGNCGGRAIAKGASVRVLPASSTNYYVRGEGVCNNTACVSVPIIVDKMISGRPIIVAPDKVYRGKKTTLSVTGATLPTGVEWRWYKDRCDNGKPIGIGSSINVYPKSPTTYYVMALGRCNRTGCGSITLSPEKVHYSSRYYDNKYAFLQYGFGIGLLEYQNFYVLADVDNLQSQYQELIRIRGLGLPLEASFHPFMKENFSCGIMTNTALGTTYLLFSGGEKEGANGYNLKERYFYYRWNIGAEVAIGLKKMKLLFTINRTYQKDQYNLVKRRLPAEIYYTYSDLIEQQITGLGLRLGRYLKTGYSSPSIIDVLYTFTERSPSNFLSFDLHSLPGHAHGLSFTWWKMSNFKIKFDIQLAETGTFLLDSKWLQPNFQASFILNWNHFY